MSREEFAEYMRQVITEEYGCVPIIGIADAVERIADRYDIEVQAAISRTRTELGAW